MENVGSKRKTEEGDDNVGKCENRNDAMKWWLQENLQDNLQEVLDKYDRPNATT